VALCISTLGLLGAIDPIPSVSSSQQAMESLAMRDTHRTPDMPSRGMRIALDIIKRIPVTLHVGTKDCYEDQSSEGAECVNGFCDWRGSM
jgi:hypothetical protein